MPTRAATPNTGPATPASASGSATSTTDNTAPTGTFVDPIPAVRTIDNASETHSITFSEAVTGLDETDFATSTGATVTAVTDSGDQTTYTITFTPTAATFTLILAADSIADGAATPNTGPATPASASGSATSTTDNTAPSVNLGNEIADGVVGEEQDHDFTFDEPVTGLEASDFSGTGIFGRITLSGSGSAYTITIIPTAESFTLTLDANSVVDLSANAGPAAEPVAARSVSGSATRADFNTDTTAPHAHFDVITGAMINARGDGQTQLLQRD